MPGLGTDYIIRYLSDISGAVKGAKQIEAVNSTMAKKIQDEYGQVTRKISDLETTRKSIPILVNGKEAIKTLTTTGAVFDTTSGKILQLSKVTTQIGNDFKTTAVDAKNITSQFKLGNLEAEKGGKVFSNFMNTVKQLGGRALLTIPIWVALRGAIMGVFSGISGGIQNLIAFDLALQKIRNNLQGTPAEVDSAFKKIRASITEASKATGISTEELADAVKQFATLGFSANESLQGALGASKLSIALFGDAGQTAGAFARALNIMIDRSKGAKSAIDQMNEAFALTSQLEETNNFEIKNVTEALDKFGGTAAGVGLTMNQTLAILAALGTAGRRGSEGATLLSTSFNQLLANIPKISKSLGLVVDAGESTFTTFTRILNKVTELNNTPGGQASAISAISDVFGGARGIKIVQSLIAVKDILDKNIATLPSFTALNVKAARTLESESGQAKQLGNDLKEMAKSFITAMAGSEDFTKAIVKIRDVVKVLGGALNGIGTTINGIFSNLGLIAGAAFLINFRTALTSAAIISTFTKFTAAFDSIGVFSSIAFRKGFLQGFKTLGALALASLKTGFSAGAGTVLAGVAAAVFSPFALAAYAAAAIIPNILIDNMVKGINAKNNKIIEESEKLIDALKGQLAIPDLQIMLNDLIFKQKPGDKTAQLQINAIRSQILKQMNAGLSDIKPTVEIKPLISFADEQEIAKKVLDFKLNELKLQGATNFQLESARKLYTEQLGIVEDIKEKTQSRLNLEMALQEETKNLGDTLKTGVIDNQIKFLELLGASQVQVIKNRIEYEAIANLNQTQNDLLKNELDLQKAIGEEAINLDNIQKNGFIDNQLEILRLQGASEVQLVKQRIEYERMYNINQTSTDFLKNELSINKAITQEKYNQNKISSDSVKLFELSQKFGVSTAQQTQQFIKGDLGLNQISLVSKLGQALTEFFPEVLKQRQAQEFFNTGEGRSIGIPETKNIRDFNISPLPIGERFRLPDIKTDIGNINIEIKKLLGEQETAKQIKDRLIEAIRNDPQIETAINEKIDNF
jgi:TP901 family phage tail tape measure protein